MGGYGTIGILLFFGVLVLTAYILLHSHSIKITLEDRELKRATMIVRLRNVAACVGLLAVSFYFLLTSGMQAMPRGSAGYDTRGAIAMYLLYIGVALLAIATYLVYISRQSDFNFERSLQRYAVKEKLRARAKMKISQTRGIVKRKRSTRV